MGPVRKPILHKFLNFYIKFGNLLFPEYPFTSYENADAVCVGGREAAALGQADANPVENHRPHRGQDSRSVPGEVPYIVQCPMYLFAVRIVQCCGSGIIYSRSGSSYEFFRPGSYPW